MTAHLPLILISATLIWTCCVPLFRRTAISPGLIIAGIFIVCAWFGPWLWDYSRESHGSGLPAEIVTDLRTTLSARTALSWAAVGAIAGAIACAPKKWNHSKRPVSTQTQQGLLLASAMTLTLWLIGQGTSVVIRDQYLAMNGVTSLARATCILGPALEVLVIFVVRVGLRNRHNRVSLCLFFAWWVTLLATASRWSVVLLGALAVALFFDFGHRHIGRIPILLTLIWATPATFAVTLSSRQQRNGFLALANMIQSADLPTSGSGLLSTVRQMTASFGSSFPIIGMSAYQAPTADTLMSLASPLPAYTTGFDLNTAERLWPYAWMPLSFVGELYGSIGGPAVAAFFGLIAYCSGRCMKGLSHTGADYAVSVLILLSTIILAGFSLQYSSRMIFRQTWVLLGLWIACWIRYMRRRDSSHDRQDRPTPGLAAYPQSKAS